MGLNCKKRFQPEINFRVIIALIIGSVIYLQSFAQEMPPRPIAGGNIIQNLNFGAFSTGLFGGTVTVSTDGLRFSTGDIVLFPQGYPYYPAIFTLVGNPGTIVHVLNGPDATLTGNYGGTLLLHLGDTAPSDPIIINVTPPALMEVRIGGTLTVGNSIASPPGIYNGSFEVMFIQE
jgi:hypothetical protein